MVLRVEPAHASDTMVTVAPASAAASAVEITQQSVETRRGPGAAAGR